MRKSFGRVLLENQGGLDDTVDLLVQAMEMLGYRQGGGRAAISVRLLGGEPDRFLVLDSDEINGDNTDFMDALASHLVQCSGGFALIALCIDSDMMWVQLNGADGSAALEIGPIEEPDYGESAFVPGPWRALLPGSGDWDALEALRTANYRQAEDALHPLASLLRFRASSVIDGCREGERPLWEGQFRRY